MRADMDGREAVPSGRQTAVFPRSLFFTSTQKHAELMLFLRITELSNDVEGSKLVFVLVPHSCVLHAKHVTAGLQIVSELLATFKRMYWFWVETWSKLKRIPDRLDTAQDVSNASHSASVWLNLQNIGKRKPAMISVQHSS